MTSNQQYIDTHCHLDLLLKKNSQNNFSSFTKKHYPENFDGCLTISCDPLSIPETLYLLNYKHVYAGFGIHPHEARHYNKDLEQSIKKALNHEKALAWGEIGLDYHYNVSSPEIQRKVFIRQITEAIKLNMPIIIHSREADADTLSIMKDYVPKDWYVHVHCYTGSVGTAETYLHTFSNLYIGFTGVITFKNAVSIQEAVDRVPLHKILLETDAPYMAPIPHRGKICHSGFIPIIAEKIAALKNIALNDVYKQVRENTRHMYGI